MFRIEHSNSNGNFMVQLNHPVSCETMQQLALIASNVLSDAAKELPEISPEQQENLLTHLRNSSSHQQTRLGEKPVSSIMMGSYVEPHYGVRIRLLSFPSSDKMRAIRMISEATGISTIGSKEILYANYPCPILAQEIADKILIGLADLGIHAKIVDADEKTGPIASIGR